MEQTPPPPLAATRCGIIAVVGAPNAGKSTLVNQLTGAKVSIVTHKAQTTRQRILGIFVHDGAQVILADTPGIFAPAKSERAEQAMVNTALNEAHEADAILFVVDASRRKSGQAMDTLERLPAGKPRFLALNKIDLTPREQLLPLADTLQQAGDFAAVFMISASAGYGCADLKKTLAGAVPHGPFLYDADALTDMPERLWAAEITREQAFLQLHDEIPYRAHVETLRYEDGPEAITITQNLLVAHDRHKAMAIGKNAARIKMISTRARAQLTQELGKPVHLMLEVIVDPTWETRFYK